MKKRFESNKIKKSNLCKPKPDSPSIRIKTLNILENIQFKKTIDKAHKTSKLKIFPSKFTVSNFEYYSFVKKNLLDSKQQISKNKIIKAKIKKAQIKFFKLVLNLELKSIRKKCPNYHPNSNFKSQFFQDVDLLIRLDQSDLKKFSENANLTAFLEFDMLNHYVCFFRIIKKIFFFKNLTHFISIEINQRKKEFDQMKKLLLQKKVCKMSYMTKHILNRINTMLNCS